MFMPTTLPSSSSPSFLRSRFFRYGQFLSLSIVIATILSLLITNFQILPVVVSDSQYLSLSVLDLVRKHPAYMGDPRYYSHRGGGGGGGEKSLPTNAPSLQGHKEEEKALKTSPSDIHPQKEEEKQQITEPEKPEPEKPEPEKPEDEKPEVAKSEDEKPEVAKPEVAKSEDEKPEIPKHEDEKLKKKKPEAEQSEASKAEDEKPEASEKDEDVTKENKDDDLMELFGGSSSSSSMSFVRDEKNPFEIVFLFLTYRGMYHPELWQRWYEDGVDRMSPFVSVHGALHYHSRFEERDVKLNTPNWLRNDIMNNSKENVSWGNYNVVIADLIEYALMKWPKAKYFFQVSDSAIPLRRMDFIVKQILNEGVKSVFELAGSHQVVNNGRGKPKNVVYKHTSWFHLSRDDAELLNKHRDDWLTDAWFYFADRMAAPDEWLPLHAITDHKFHFENTKDLDYAQPLQDMNNVSSFLIPTLIDYFAPVYSVRPLEQRTAVTWDSGRIQSIVGEQLKNASPPKAVNIFKPSFFQDLCNSTSLGHTWFFRKTTRGAVVDGVKCDQAKFICNIKLDDVTGGDHVNDHVNGDHVECPIGQWLSEYLELESNYTYDHELPNNETDLYDGSSFQKIVGKG